MLDGVGLRDSWYTALDAAQTNFRQLLTSHSSPEWKRVKDNNNGTTSTNPKGKARASSVPQPSDVILHRKVVKGQYVYRAVLDIALGEDGAISLDTCKSVLLSPELRKEWDPAVEGAQLLEMCDQVTRIVKTNFTLGWPASPRDAVTISRTFNDATTLIDVSTSLPRSPNEPMYLRPSPPYVRSEVALFAWCLQLLKPTTPPNDTSKSPSLRMRMICFWQHDLRAPWNLVSTSSFVQQLSSMMVGFFKTVQTRGSRIPLLLGYGNGVSVERIRFESDREALSVDYSIVPEDNEVVPYKAQQGMEELHAIREHRRLTRSIECALPAGEGWDVQLSTKASSDEVSRLPYTVHATRNAASTETPDDKITFLVKHAELPNEHSVLKVSISIERSSPSGLRLNGTSQTIERLEERDPSSYFMSEQMMQGAASTAEMSLQSQSTFNTTGGASSSSTLQERPQLTRTLTERTAAAEKSILSRVKRNYIYFSSLLQEPEAKWKRTTEAKGVSIAQLDSIDPTLVVYRAEATFVGLGLWDLYATIVSPGARVHWDKMYDDALLLEDVNQLTELWQWKTKPAWPVNGRDAVVLKTVYKSPTTIHVFAFSADDPNLFPNMPPLDLNVIRTQVDLQGWAIEALSPTTTLLTLLEQSDPKGWTNKTSIPQQMITTMTGVGEFAIKFGGPPIITRLDGAKANEMRYDHEKGSFRIEYEAAPDRRGGGPDATVAASTSASAVASVITPAAITATTPPTSPTGHILECELRCDLDAWASSLDIIIDPPPMSITCLRRHRLSSGGGGLWLTISHDAVHANGERLQAIVRRAPQGGTKEKGLVMVNGAKVDVDVEELPDREVKSLSKKKRVKPVRIPLDQPPVEGAIRRRRAEWDAEQEQGGKTPTSPTGSGGFGSTSELSTAAPKFASAWTKYFSYAVEQATTTTQQAVAAMAPATGSDAVPSSSKLPMQYALEALSYVQNLHASSNSDGWTAQSDKDFPIHRKLVEQISPVIPVHKGEKVIEGVSAEEVASVIMSYDCRKQWDTRFDSANVLESFGAGAHTSFVVTKGGFPFRDRGFYLASIVVRQTIASSTSNHSGSSGGSGSALRRSSVGTSVGTSVVGDTEQHTDGRAAIFCVSASFSPQSASSPFSSTKCNPYNLPVGRVFLDGWILETLDPYTPENYAIPSTRCTRVAAVDYGGSVPAAMNSMMNGLLPKSILAVETYVKSKSPPPFMRLPAPNLVVSGKPEDSEDAGNGVGGTGVGVGASATAVATAVGDVGGSMGISLPPHWMLKKRDPGRVAVTTGYQPVERKYQSVMLINMAGQACLGSPNLNNDRTPRPSRFIQSPRTPSPGDKNVSANGNNTSDQATVLASTSTSPPGGSRTPDARSRSRDASTSIRSSSAPSSSMFTVRGEVRHPVDLLVSELVVDSKLYPEGYEVVTTSHVDKGKSLLLPLPLATPLGPAPTNDARNTSTSSNMAESKTTITNETISAISNPSSEPSALPSPSSSSSLPIAFMIYTLPPSPHHSAGLNVDRPPRHLLRLTLPTAQYQVSTILDPLTGETRRAPPKPQWFLDLEEVGRAVVGVTIKPLTKETVAAAGADTSGASGSVVKKGEDKDKEKSESMVYVDGKMVNVLNEKASLTSIGRDELLDGRIGKMDLLVRSDADTDAVPTELQKPIAVAEHLRDESAPKPVVLATEVVKEETESAPPSTEDKGETSDAVVPAPPETRQTDTLATGLLLRFWGSYPNPLLRFSSTSSSASTPTASPRPGSVALASAGTSAELQSRGNGITDVGKTKEEKGLTNGEAARAGGDTADGVVGVMAPTGRAHVGGRRFSMSAIIMAALIGFLVGSLVRSLISPADFIYVSKDMEDAASATERVMASSGGGWREIRRLVEVKYIAGGWDFQIAVVRRHHD